MASRWTPGRAWALVGLSLLSACNERVSPDSYIEDVRASCRAVCERQVECLTNPAAIGDDTIDRCTDSCAALEPFDARDQCASRMVLHNQCKAATETCEDFNSAWFFELPCGPEVTPSVFECSEDEPYDLDETP